MSSLGMFAVGHLVMLAFLVMVLVISILAVWEIVHSRSKWIRILLIPIIPLILILVYFIVLLFKVMVFGFAP